ncbi:hypothetical protein LR48_Vigan05g076900 [Vigna angularis]|uniref:Ubiquitin-like protease family profile domain-containing protein n=1 Tax=Phaseolus angularis TaxID=3914 RepID=A0A0L9UJV4_PHAAN|nr:hypothetical protein LR48_Vigan05g076900 [Vigna angularis]
MALHFQVRWDDAPEGDKNLLWQDIQQHYDISNTIQIRKKVLSHIAIRWRNFKTRLTRLYVFGDRQHENPCQQYTFIEEDWMQFRASRESEEWKGKRLAAQERQRLNDAPHLLSRGGYAKLEKKLRKSRADALGLESPDLAPAPARYEMWKAARTKSDGNMTSSSAALISQRIDELVEQQTQGTFAGQDRDNILTTAIGRPEHPRRVPGVPWSGDTEADGSLVGGNTGATQTPTPPRVSTRGSCSAVEPTQYSGQYELLVDVDLPRIMVVGRVLEGGQTIHGVAILPQHFTRPQKQPIHDTIIHEDDDMAEAEDDPLSKLMTKLPRLKKAPLELYWDLRVFGVPPHVPVYITFSDALEKQTSRVERLTGYRTWICSVQIEAHGAGNVPTVLNVERRRNGTTGSVAMCNQQLDSWKCGFYVMCWIKTIIRAVITDDWNERFKSTSPIPEDTIRKIRQEWTAYLLQRWS